MGLKIKNEIKDEEQYPTLGGNTDKNDMGIMDKIYTK